jgi:hypothetical protein
MIHPNAQELAEPNTILRGVVGSTVHGLSVADQDDRDEMGICVEPFEHFFGLRPKFEQWTYRTQPEGARSGPGDLDLTIYSLAKWCRLALKGNPTVLTLLFLPPEFVVSMDDRGQELVAMREAFVSHNLFGPYLGYMIQQRKRLTDKVKMPNRPELIERYGFDTKYAGHIIRLGHQGIELATTGKLTLPMAEPVRQHIIDIRTGKVTQDEVLREAADLEQRLKTLESVTSLGPPDVERVERFVLDCYLQHPK